MKNKNTTPSEQS